MYNTTQYFGYELKKSKSVEKDLKKRKSFAVPEINDGALNIEMGEGGGVGYFSQSYIDIDGAIREEQQLIKKYREITYIPEVDDAVEQIINEAIVTNEDELPIHIVLDDVDKVLMSEKTKKLVAEEFEFLVKLMNLKTRGHDVFRNWYIDGKMYYHKIIDDKNSKKGIRELRPLDPTRTKKVREIHKKKDENGVEIVHEINEYYIYMPEHAGTLEQGYKISPDAITYCPSGLTSVDRKMSIGHLYKALRPANQLKMMEDALVIYRLARAPERRVFYIDVGSLPKAKAEQYLENMMRRYKNKLVYEATTGEVRNDKNHTSMLEDYWLPRREGTDTTSIETIGGGANLGEIDDIIFFQKKLLKSMNVPISRLESENSFTLGRSSEITRDELKFNKFIQRLRAKFSEMFYDMLGTHLVLKQILKKEEWEAVRKDVRFDFLRDSYFSEMKEAELLSERLDLMQRIDPYLGRFFSDDKVMKNILHMDEEEIKEEKKQMEKEKEERPEDDESSGGGGFGRRF